MRIIANRLLNLRVDTLTRRVCLVVLSAVHITGASLMLAVLFLLVSVNAFTQPMSFVDALQRKLDAYYATNTPLIIDMTFNQPTYVAGDTAWFSLWLTTEREGRPLPGRQVVNVNVLTPGGDVVLREKVLMSNGLGRSQLVVPHSLPAGIYTVVSWTEQMQHGRPDLYSYKELVIGGEKYFTRASMPLAAYPEGGRFVEGALNRIVVTGPPEITVALNGSRQLLQTLKLDAHGYGDFEIKAEPGVQYTVSGGDKTAELVPAPDAIALILDFPDSSATLSVKLRSVLHRESCQLTVVSRGRLVYSALVGFKDQQAVVTIPRKNLPNGLMLMTIFDGENDVLAERLFMAQESPGIQIQTPGMAVHPRDHVPISIQAPELAGATVTVSIYAEDIFLNAAKDSWLPATRLSRGGLDFDIHPSWTMQQWNSFLITQTWKRFQWADVWNGRDAGHQAVSSYLTLKGRVIFPETQASFDSVRVTFYFREEARIYELFVSPSGAFDFPLVFDFDGTDEVIYTVDRKGTIIRDATVRLDEEPSPTFSFRNFNKTTTNDGYSVFSRLREETRNAYRNYDLNVTAVVADPNARIEDELSSADIAVNLDDYVLFPTMEETLREVIPRLQHRWRGKQHTVRAYLTEPDILADDDPVYFIDGVLTDDTDYFMGLNPRNVATIKIISKQRKLQTMGILGRNGIVLVTTKVGDGQVQVPRSRKSFTAVGFTRPIEFPNDVKVSSRTPLLRSSAYFNPTLILDKDGGGQFEFSAPDNVGRFRIEVSGVTHQGLNFKSFTTVRVASPATSP